MQRRAAPSRLVSRSALLALALVLAACGQESDEETPIDKEAAYSTMEEDLTQCPGNATLQGIDVSVWQGHVDWHQVKSSGRAFGVARVSYGTSFDSTFTGNWSGMKQAGLVRGAYVFFRPSEDPVAQANVLLQHVGTLGTGDLPPVLDVEVTEGASKSQMAHRIGLWADRIQAVTGRKPIIYSGAYFWDGDVGSTAFAADPLWLPSYGVNCALLPSAWHKWTIHQYSSTGRVPGVSGNVDVNVFNGTRADLDKLAGGASCAVTCSGKVAVDAQCHRTDCGAIGDVCVKDSQGARCVNPKCPATGTADVCISSTERGHCSNGKLTPEQNCGAIGDVCVKDAQGGRCVSPKCPATGTADICVSSTERGHCANGKLTPEEDCGAKSEWCSVAGVSAHAARCVSKTCVSGPTQVPAAHVLCEANHQGIVQCDASGKATVAACSAGLTCSADGGAHCVSPVCPPTGKIDVCLEGAFLTSCANGVVTDKSDCRAKGAFCSTAGGEAAHCASSTCVATASTVPVAHDVCLDAESVAHCDAKGVLSESTTCAGGSRCVVADGAATCEEPPTPDAGTPDEPDAGTPTIDAGNDTGVDAGTDTGGGDAAAPGGCHCSSTPLGAAQFALLGLLARRRRR